MLTLYYKPTCPYCQKVLFAIESLDVNIDLKNVVEDASSLNELIEKGGKSQIPFLEDSEHGISMYESDDIIAYLKDKYPNKESTPKVEGVRIHRSDSGSCDVD